jgi:hypothetical protein
VLKSGIQNPHYPTLTIKSTIGTFYPGLPRISQTQGNWRCKDTGKVVCIIEAKKLFNERKRGKGRKKLVDASPVEYDQALFS